MTPSNSQLDHPIDVRLKIAALWTSTMMIFAYVDLFSLYRPDVLGDIESGSASVFAINQTFLFFTTLYIVVPSLMIYLSLVMPRRLSRTFNITVAALYAITIVGAAVGEWNYYILGSVIEVVLLAAVVRHAWTWRERAPVVTHRRSAPLTPTNAGTA